MDVQSLLPADALKPRWSSASSLVYIGAFTILVATLVLLAILGDMHGDWAAIGYSAIATALALGLALGLEQSTRPVAASVIVTVAVLFFAVVVGALESAIGILDVEIEDYQPGSLIVEAATIAAAFVALRRFRAPLLVLPIALIFWIVVADLGSIGSWDNSGEVLSTLVGIALILVGITVDRAGRAPYGLWLHVLGGIALMGGVLSFIEGDVAWFFFGLLSLAYVAASYLLGRSSYAVLGTIGVLATTTYFSLDGFSFVGAFVPFGEDEISGGSGLDPWQIALSFVAAGLVIVLLGLVENRVTALRAREPHLQSGDEDRGPGSTGELP